MHLTGNQIRYQINTVCLDKGVAYTKGGGSLADKPKGGSTSYAGLSQRKKKHISRPITGQSKSGTPPFEWVQRARKESTMRMPFWHGIP